MPGMQDEIDLSQATIASSSNSELSQLQLTKLEAEIAKLKVETENLQHQSRSENVRFWIPIGAPFVGSIALVATLLFQVVQFNENAKMAREATEATQFREALQSAQSNASRSGQAAASMIRLSSFLNSPTYGADTRHVLTPLLVELAVLGEFKEFHTRMFPVIRYSDLQDVVEVSRIQSEIDDQAGRRSTQLQSQLDQAKNGLKNNAPGAEASVSNLQSSYDDAEESLNKLEAEISIISGDILSALKQKPPSASPDLSYTSIFDTDFTDVDFGSSDFTEMQMLNCGLSNADLSKVQAFDGSQWRGTQWWLAKAISPKLLSYLRDNAPFDSSVSYRGATATQADYEKRLSVLEGK